MVASLHGIITPLVTPFDNGRIDRKAISKLNEFVEGIGVAGIFPASSTGCFSFLTEKEHVELLRIAHDSMGKGISFVPGIGRNSIQETLSVAKAASRLEPAAVVVVTPYYIKLSEESLFSYFDTVARGTEEDILLYNIPQLTGVSISARLAARLARAHRNIIGMKESSGDFRNFAGLMDRKPKGFLVFQGQDDLLLDSLMMGADGGVCGTTNFSDTAVHVYEAYKSGQTGKAKRLQDVLTSMMKKVNVAQFPAGYNFMFYERVMHSVKTNAVPPVAEVSGSQAAALKALGKRMASV